MHFSTDLSIQHNQSSDVITPVDIDMDITLRPPDIDVAINPGFHVDTDINPAFPVWTDITTEDKGTIGTDIITPVEIDAADLLSTDSAWADLECTVNAFEREPTFDLDESGPGWDSDSFARYPDCTVTPVDQEMHGRSFYT